IGFAQPIVIVAPIIIVLSTTFVGMRVWSRAVILRVFALEDWFLLLGWVCTLCSPNCRLFVTRHGLGHIFTSLPPDVKVEYLKISMVNNIVYALALTSVKISILCLYLRALRYDYLHKATKAMLVIVVLTHLWIIASLLTACVPISALWDISLRKKAYCHGYSVYWSHSIINICTDFAIFTLPLFVLRKMRVPPRQKIALGLVFVLAFSVVLILCHSVCVISLLRTLQFVHGITKGDRATVTIGCWTIVEPNLAVICACLTTLQPLVSRLFPKLLDSTGSTADNLTEIKERAGSHGLETIGRRTLGRRNRCDPLTDSDFTIT
ncbi:hypothetical protein QBC43DRAFT_168384, partial [Cladorrhinum sp. PSN259]